MYRRVRTNEDRFVRTSDITFDAATPALILAGSAAILLAVILGTQQTAPPPDGLYKPQSVAELDYLEAHGMTCMRKGGEYVCY
jgi:hypothetical protein